jgi:hypothetical protein
MSFRDSRVFLIRSLYRLFGRARHLRGDVNTSLWQLPEQRRYILTAECGDGTCQPGPITIWESKDKMENFSKKDRVDLSDALGWAIERQVQVIDSLKSRTLKSRDHRGLRHRKPRPQSGHPVSTASLADLGLGIARPL